MTKKTSSPYVGCVEKETDKWLSCKRMQILGSDTTKDEEGLQTSELQLSCSGFDWDVGFPASAILIAVIIKIDKGVSCKLS